MKLKLDGVAETLFITLYIRAKDAMSDKPILNDKLSLEIMEKLIMILINSTAQRVLILEH